MSKKYKGIVICLFFSFMVLYYFFGTILAKPNNYYFDTKGDGWLTYYYANYQVKYDSTYWHVGAPNYPYGENAFFSSNQPIITAALKFINTHLFSVENYVVGIFNVLMLFSFPLCALFLFLIFYEFKIPYVGAALCATAIAFLSPQLIRLEMHFPLSYPFAIPALLYFIMKYDENPTLKKNIGIAFFVFVMAAIHLYFFGFFAAILLGYYFSKCLTKQKFISRLKNSLIAILVQLVIPFFILYLLIHSSNDVNDRPQYPSGILEYVSNFDGMFFPYEKPYSEILRKFYSPGEVQMEGTGYFGLFGIVMSIFIFCYKIFQAFKFRFKNIFRLPDNKLLFVFLLTGIATAIYACGFPFIYKPGLLHYAGLLRQMRGIGRFIWILYYILNIYCVYVFVQWISQLKNKNLRLVIWIFPLSMLFYDMYYQVKQVSVKITNKVPKLDDRLNNLPGNKWIKEIDVKKYQAIIPIPYFQAGSDNVALIPSDEIVYQTYIASVKTALPITAFVLTRTSLWQTYDNIALALEAYRPLEIVKHFPNKKPFLLLVKENEVNDMQRSLVNASTLIKTTPDFNIYELQYNALQTYSDSLYYKTYNKFNTSKTYLINNFSCTDSVQNFLYRSYDNSKTTNAYRGGGAYTGKMKEKNNLFEGTIPWYKSGDQVILSFWMKDFTKELYPRTNMEIIFTDSINQVYKRIETQLFSYYLRTLDNSWALLEINITPENCRDKIKFSLWNREIPGNLDLVIDELLIRSSTGSIYKSFPGEIYFNNRYYKK